MSADAAFQQALARALLAPADAAASCLPGIATQPAFAVYRNTVMKACIDALAANFPAVERLVGADWFRSAAARYAQAEPPRDGRLLCYGAGFPGFLAQQVAALGPAADLPYLADVARLDRAWTEAHAAADAEPLDPARLAALPPERLAATVLRLHPAARWCWSEDTPAFALWQQQRAPGTDGQPIDWRGDGGLLTRPAGQVRWQAIDRAQADFLQACADGLALASAAEAVLQRHPATDIAALLHALLPAGCFTPEEMP